MTPATHEVNRCLTLLRNKIREQGFTQLEVQAALGWGRSYISQLLTRQKNLRLDQVLLILSVIGVDPEEFFAELYPAPFHARHFESRSNDSQKLDELRQLLRGLVDLLLEKGILSAEDLPGRGS